jgi:nitrate/nitrite transporter NarK
VSDAQPRAVVAAHQNRRALVLSTIAFTVAFAAWGLIGGLAATFADLYE